MSLFDQIKLALKLKKVASLVEKETKAGFSWQVNAKKGLQNFILVSGAVMVAAFADYFSVPEKCAILFSWLPESVQTVAAAALTPLVAAGAMQLSNWIKNRKNEIVMVVPVEAQMAGDRRKTPTPVHGAVPVPISMKPAVPPATVPTIPASDAGV